MQGKVRPAPGYLLVRKRDASGVDADGIYVVDDVEGSNSGKIIAVNETDAKEAAKANGKEGGIRQEYSVGDTVMFDPNTAIDVMDANGEEVTIVNTNGVFCYIPKEEEVEDER